MATLQTKSIGTIILPQELCGQICNHLPKHNLYAVRHVSRAFRAEAERILFVSVKLVGEKAIKGFSMQVFRRPELGSIVHRLSLWLPPLEAMEATDLARILLLCKNMKHLTVQAHIGREDAIFGWLLEGQTFRLKSFTNSYIRSLSLYRFFQEQEEIETISLTSAPPIDEALPNLRNVITTPSLLRRHLTYMGKPRRIERLHLILEGSSVELSTALNDISTCAKTLKCLNISAINYSDIVQGCRSIASHCPNLKFLQLMDIQPKEEIHQELISVLCSSSFKKLETLIIEIRPNVLNAESGTDTEALYDNELRNHKSSAGKLMETLKTLRRVVLSGWKASEYTRAGSCEPLKMQEIDIIREDNEEWLHYG